MCLWTRVTRLGGLTEVHPPGKGACVGWLGIPVCWELKEKQLKRKTYTHIMFRLVLYDFALFASRRQQQQPADTV
jgi:hypothetical protein